ncbi:MAG TPA: hypothetical protein VMV92_08935 [Streptosporangiaceae bacterium]|nr:hypothetical protein [Streptosporangiaceae bacterium]
MLSNPLAGYVRLAARHGDAVRVPFVPQRSFFLLSRPEHAGHVLAANQDNYVKAFTYRPLRALVGNGLLTSEGEVMSAAAAAGRGLPPGQPARWPLPLSGPACCALRQRAVGPGDVQPEGPTQPTGVGAQCG